jgi:hypothetical protein
LKENIFFKKHKKNKINLIKKNPTTKKVPQLQMGPYVGTLKNEHLPKVVLNKDSKVQKANQSHLFNLQVNNALFPQ